MIISLLIAYQECKKNSPLKVNRNASLLPNLKVYAALGIEVATLVNEQKPAVTYEVEFNVAQSASGGSSPDISSGIYFYQLKVGSFVETKKMVLLK